MPAERTATNAGLEELLRILVKNEPSAKELKNPENHFDDFTHLLELQ
jgi:hypothetical protein